VTPVVDNPAMEPRKDYEDYSRFINDVFGAHKRDLAASSYQTRPGTMKNSNPIMSLRVNT
jgi:hypothetical protein